MSLFNSLQARIIIFMALPVVFITQRSRFNSWAMVVQLLVYLGIAYNAECLVEGGCGMWSWVSISLPLLYSILYIFFSQQLRLKPRPPSPPTIIMPIEQTE